MSERGSTGATVTIVVVIVIAVSAMCLVPLANTAKKADNVSQTALQSALTDFANEECNKSGVYEEDFYKLKEEITGPHTYDVELQIYVLGEDGGKKTSQAVSDNSGENRTIYYMSQIEDVWKNNNGVFDIDERAQVYVYAMNTDTTMGTELTSPTSSDISNIIAEATATCNK